MPKNFLSFIFSISNEFLITSNQPAIKHIDKTAAQTYKIIAVNLKLTLMIKASKMLINNKNKTGNSTKEGLYITCLKEFLIDDNNIIYTFKYFYDNLLTILLLANKKTRLKMLRFSKKHSYQGILICVEGIDGSGKSTQIELLYNYLQQNGVDVILTQWNSSSLISSTTKKAKKKNMLSGRTFSLLHAVDFADRLEGTIKPALKAGFVVLADRYVYTAFARDVARKVDAQWVRNMYGFAIKPDLTFYFDVSPKDSLDRICANREPKFYEAGMDMKLSNNPYKSYIKFQTKIVEEYKKMIDEYGLIQVDATKSIHEKQFFIRQKVKEVLKRNNIILKDDNE